MPGRTRGGYIMKHKKKTRRPAEPGATQYDAVEAALTETEYNVTEDTVFFSTAPYNDHVSAVIGNHYFCTVD